MGVSVQVTKPMRLSPHCSFSTVLYPQNAFFFLLSRLPCFYGGCHGDFFFLPLRHPGRGREMNKKKYAFNSMSDAWVNLWYSMVRVRVQCICVTGLIISGVNAQGFLSFLFSGATRCIPPCLACHFWVHLVVCAITFPSEWWLSCNSFRYLAIWLVLDSLSELLDKLDVRMDSFFFFFYHR